MSVKRETMVRKYSQAIREGNAAVFAGAGLSRPSGFVDWRGLLRPLASEIGLDVDKETDLLSIAQFYRNKQGIQTPTSQAILDAFSKGVETNENIRILSRLPIFTYWTTNYDELLESGIREANRNPDVKSEADQLSIMKPDRDAIVYKMHGDVARPAHAVLTRSDYERYENTRPLFRTALKGDLVSKTFLFVGFSFEDPNIDYILGQIRALLGENVPKHYCFFKRVQREDYQDSESFGYAKAKQEMKEEDLRGYGIHAVFIDSYGEITEILRDIERAVKMREVFISGSADMLTPPWDDGKAGELAGKLAHALVSHDYRITCGFGLGIGSAIINGALEVIYSDKFRHMDEHLRLRPFPQDILDPAERAERWSRYREDMIGETGVSVFMFGNKEMANGKIVEADGCIKEFEIAKRKGNLIIPIGSTGYAARTIYEDVKGHIEDYPYLESHINQLGEETDVDELVRLVMGIVEEQTN